MNVKGLFPKVDKFQIGGIVYTPFSREKKSQIIEQPTMFNPVEVEDVNVQGYKPEYTIIEETYQETPQEQTNTPKRGQTVYKHSGIDLGEAKGVIDALETAGISVRVTSGKENRGNNSRHVQGQAIDITPIEGQTFEDLRQQIKEHPEVLQYLIDDGWGILEETTPDVMRRTGATGAHWHIGKDSTRDKWNWIERFR